MYFDAFVERRPDLALTEVRESERPDFICLASGILTGIEMTRFFFPSVDGIPPQAINGYRDQVAQSLREEHLRRALPPLHASVHLFSDDKLLSGAARRQMTVALVDFVGSNIPAIGPGVEFQDLPAALVDLGVDRISVIRTAALTRPTWSLPYASYIPESRSSMVQAIITEKSALAGEYRKQASALWLMIVSGTDGLHSIIDLDGDVLSTLYASDFDRVFLFRTFGPSIHELKTA